MLRDIFRQAKIRPNQDAIRWVGFGESLRSTRSLVSVSGGIWAMTYSDMCRYAVNLSRVFGAYQFDVDPEITQKRLVVGIPSCPLLPIVQLAANCSAYSVVPVDFSAPVERWLAIVADCQCQIAIVPDELEDRIKEVMDRKGSISITFLSIGSLVDILEQHNVCDIDTFITDCSAYETKEASVFYTSGSTGKPKGCRVSPSSLEAYCIGKNRVCDVDCNAVVFVASPSLFDPSIGDFFATWMVGGTLALAPETLSYIDLWACLKETDASHVLTTPALLMNCTLGPENLLNLRVVCVGGECASSRLIEAWGQRQGLKLLNFYGVTECFGYQAYGALRNQSQTKHISSPICMDSILLGQRDNGDVAEIANLPANEIFQLVLAGPQVGLGYINSTSPINPFEMDEIHGPIFATGDYFKLLDSPEHSTTLAFVGRKDKQIKINGRRIECGEIENAIVVATKSIFTKVVVLPVKKSIHAICCGTIQHSDVWAQTVRYLSARYLPRYMVPAGVHFWEDIPLSKNGKVDHRSMARCISENMDSDFENEHMDVEPLVGMSKIVATCWAESLDIQLGLVSSRSDFRALSGDSLVALRICKLVKSRLVKANSANDDGIFGENLGCFSPVHLMANPILEDFVRHLRRQLEEGGIDIVTEAMDGTRCDPIQNLPCNDPTGGEFAQLITKAAKLGDCILLKVLLSSDEFRDQLKQEDRNSLVVSSICGGSPDCLRLSVECGGSLDAKRGPDNCSAIHFAGQQGDVPMLRELLNLNINLFAIDDNGQTIFHHAARCGCGKKFFDLISETWGQNDKSKKSRSKRLDPCHMLDKWKRTPLHWAVTNGHQTTVAALLSAGSDPQVKDVQDESALEIAERRAQCRAHDRPEGLRPSVFGAIAKLLGGSGKTQKLSASS